MRDHVCAVDVGTGSARAGVFSADGRMAGRGEHPILMHRPAAGHAEHDSEDIWRAVGAAVRAALHRARLGPERVAGIGFDATCSLVARGAGGRQVGVSASGTDNWDTIVWLDHRAIAEADECTATGHPVLDHVGGVMSPEMQTPKLMWLKRKLPASWARFEQVFDLADFLTWKATGLTARSQCTLTGKWTYLAHEDGWRPDFFAAVGLDDVLERAGLPERATAVDAALGRLTPEAAAELGLDEGCAVGVGLIDAYAGALGVIGGLAGEGADRHLALIAGTSSCVMGFSPERRMVPGIWGPYWGVALPALWLSEGGQSATGALLDHIIRIHGGGAEPDAPTHGRIVARIAELRAEEGEGFARDLHVLPDFHGNRSPFADPHALGVVSGLSLDASFDALARLYWRSCVAIALGLRHVLDHMNAHGYRIDTLHVTGGHTRNPLLMELYADATGCTVAESAADDAVLLGAAMVAANAAGLHDGLEEACRAMRQPDTVRAPDPARAAGYQRDYRVFLRMHEHRRELEAM
ncbi:MAG: FGGY-family carbohydrate kinase [Rhizobiaceae bacterium]|nr:FGGY-family carbohydrate kinase [Rhizobiaceae bacterium]MCV0406523.1 FGGY-family carbohydrate kinase [Rhizobiaceae bacterium]